jgi:hypothetical protein
MIPHGCLTERQNTPKVEDKRRVATTGRWVPYLAGKTWDVSILDPVGRTLG